MEIKIEDAKYGPWAVKNAAETLLKAEDIKKDQKLLALVKGELEKGSDAIKSIKELKSVAAKKIAEKDEVPEGEMEDEESMSDAKEDAAEGEMDGEEEDKVKPELMTEEDKAAQQKIDKYKARIKKFKLK